MQTTSRLGSLAHSARVRYFAHPPTLLNLENDTIPLPGSSKARVQLPGGIEVLCLASLHIFAWERDLRGRLQRPAHAEIPVDVVIGLPLERPVQQCRGKQRIPNVTNGKESDHRKCLNVLNLYTSLLSSVWRYFSNGNSFLL